MFHGVMTALVTPFAQGKVDETAFRMHIERQIEAGVQALVPAGTTGEAATLSFAEHKALIRITVDQSAGRVPVLAGTGSNNTAESIELTDAAKRLGADAALLISPYYNKPSQEGIYQHYAAVAKAVHLPLFLYNVPGRTASNILPETIGRLSQISNIVAVKDATANMEQLLQSMQAAEQRLDFFSGDDATVAAFMLMGGKGVISVVSNIVPQKMRALVDAAAIFDVLAARRLQGELQALNEAMFMQSNPIPVKAACTMLGWASNELRLPLTALDSRLQARLYDCLCAAGLEPIQAEL